MITLGQASNYSFGRTLRHLFAFGTASSSRRLREDLAARYYVTPEQVALYHTGRSALTVAISSVKSSKDTHVIIPGLTCIAVVRAVKAAGCTPTFVDIQRQDLAYDYQRLEDALKKLPSGSQAIILVQNTLGIAWDIQKIEQIAHRYNAIIVEDLAHSAGRIYPDGREVGTVGQAAALSFGKGKAIDTISGGAAIVRNQPKLLQPIQKPRLSDRLRDRWYPVFGGLSRIFGCWIVGGLVKIHWVQRSADAELDPHRRLTHWQAKLARRQLSHLPSSPLREYRLIKDRPEALQQLRQHGYNFDEIWYDTPVSPARYTKEADFPVKTCPETVRISQEIVNFPTWYRPARLTQAYEIIKEYEL